MPFGAGCELAVCCDIRVAADDIRMGVPPAKIGVVYPWTGLQRFIQAIGWNHTREMFFSGDVVKGPRLRTIGLVNHLVPRESLETIYRCNGGTDCRQCAFSAERD